VTFDGLLERLGVDPAQWRALLRISLRIDFPIQNANKTNAERKHMNLLGLGLLIYTLAGVTPAFIAYRSPDPLLGGASLSTIVAFMLASTLLSGEGSTIVSPNDHQILGFRPVTSRTYLAVRVGALMVRSIVISAAVAVMPMLVFLLKGDGIHPLAAIATMLDAQMTGAAVTLAIVAMYGWLLQVAGPQRMMRYVAYLQFVATTVTWLGFIAVSQGLNSRVLQGATLSGTSWWLALPPAWFGSYLPIATGAAGGGAAVGAALSVATIAAFGRNIRDKLSMTYAERLSDLATMTAVPATRARDWFGGLRDETRAIAILVRSQLEHDMKFRIGLISMLPITLFYLFMGGLPVDPFVKGAARGGPGDIGLIQVALMFMPMTLRQVLVTSDSWRASWIFHTTPADRAKLVLSARNIITAMFLIPFATVLAIVFAYAFNDAGHALLHATFLALVSWTALQFVILISPQLPFSIQPGKDVEFAVNLARMLGVVTVGMGSYLLLRIFVYRHLERIWIALLFFAVAGVLMQWLTAVRARRRPLALMYME
jgi:hypothetical protein